MTARLPDDFKPRRPVYSDRLGFFRGALYVLVAVAWILTLLAVLTTSP